MPDIAIVNRATAAAPKDYPLTGTQELLLRVVRAVMDGSAASGSYLPAVQMIAPSGDVMWSAVPSDPVAAGGSVDVSWFPGGNLEQGATQAAGITLVTSPRGTISVGSPAGPTVNLDLASSGVVTSLDSITGAVSLVAGTNVTISDNTPSAGQITIAASGGASGPGTEIGYDQITAGVNITGTTSATSTTVIAGSAHTFDGTPVMAEFFSSEVIPPTTAAGFMCIQLFEGSTAIGQIALVQNPAANNMSQAVYAGYRFSPSAASHTYSIKAFVSGTTGTPSVQANTGGAGVSLPCFLRFTKV